jgi:hypothetical protein
MKRLMFFKDLNLLTVLPNKKLNNWIITGLIDA